jgi:transcriptional regulator with XRE-family HTH domain
MSPSGPNALDLGQLLRHWRAARRMSQLQLASEGRTTPRYVSFVETGRAQPSRQMIVRLARALDIPLRERNQLFLAAGYAPVYALEPLDSPELEQVQRALTSMLEQHEPFPAVVMDRKWNVLRANSGARALFGRLLAPHPIPDDANVLRMFIEPGPVQRSVGNWDAVVPALLERARREAIAGILDDETAVLLGELRERPEVNALLAESERTPPTSPVIDVRFTVADVSLNFFSVVSTVGSPIDVTAQELRVEAFFPSDDEAREAWCRLADPEAFVSEP